MRILFGMVFFVLCVTIFLCLFRSFMPLPSHHHRPLWWVLFFIHAYAWVTCKRVCVHACIWLWVSACVCMYRRWPTFSWLRNQLKLSRSWPGCPGLSPHTSYHITAQHTSHLFSSLVLKAIVSTYKVPKASLGVTWIATSFSLCVCVCHSVRRLT